MYLCVYHFLLMQVTHLIADNFDRTIKLEYYMVSYSKACYELNFLCINMKIINTKMDADKIQHSTNDRGAL